MSMRSREVDQNQAESQVLSTRKATLSGNSGERRRQVRSLPLWCRRNSRRCLENRPQAHSRRDDAAHAVRSITLAPPAARQRFAQAWFLHRDRPPALAERGTRLSWRQRGGAGGMARSSTGYPTSGTSTSATLENQMISRRCPFQSAGTCIFGRANPVLTPVLPSRTPLRDHPWPALLASKPRKPTPEHEKTCPVHEKLRPDRVL